MVMASSSWLTRLGLQTAAYHPVADAQRLAIMDAGTAPTYRAFLERIHGFETAVVRHASTIEGLEAATAGARTRTQRLHRDLEALGLSETDIAALPQVHLEGRTVSDGLGWLFVIERNVLFAGLIRRLLATDLPDVFARARAYFDTHTDGGEQLRDFGEALRDSLVQGTSRPNAILTMARRAFEVQLAWYGRARRPDYHVVPTVQPQGYFAGV